MFIIFGTRARARPSETYVGYCPSCGGGTSLNMVQVKRWFTLFFIPVFPFSDLGRYVECADCKGTYHERLRDFDPAREARQFEAEFALAARRVMCKLALADGQIDPAEVDQIVQAFSNIAGREATRTEIEAELEAARNDPRSVRDFLSAVAPRLNDTGKELVLRAAIAVVKSDGRIEPDEVSELHRLAAALDLPRAYANGIFAEEGISKM
jgi:tellurite resistance protein